MAEFNPTRLSLARKRRGLSKVKLAENVGVSTRALQMFEDGSRPPCGETLNKLSRSLCFPIEFFAGPTLFEPKPESASFRSLKRMTASQRDAALGAGALGIVVADWIEQEFSLDHADLPDLSNHSPEEAAVVLRAYWNLGSGPIPSMVHLLEEKGVIVFSLAEDCAEVDAFSLWRDFRPYVFLNTKKSSERSRLDAAHELGHLVMHRFGMPADRDPERDANAFASAFLMPAESVLAAIRRTPSVDGLIRLKRGWGVSVAALAYRLHHLELLTEWQYRTMAIEVSQRGFRTHEPDSISRETSEIFRNVFGMLLEEGRRKVEIARELCIPLPELEALTFGVLMSAVDGGRQSSTPPISGIRPNLQLLPGKFDFEK